MSKLTWVSKKLVLFVLVCILSFSIVACDKTTTESITSQNTTDTVTTMIEEASSLGFIYGTRPLFENTLISVQTADDLWGFINSNGEMVIDALYDAVTYFNNDGYALVYFNIGEFGQMNIINMQGDELLPRNYDGCEIYYGYILGESNYPALKEIFYDVYDMQGNLILEAMTSKSDIATELEIEIREFIPAVGLGAFRALMTDLYTYKESDPEFGYLYGLMEPNGNILLDAAYLNRISFDKTYVDTDITYVVDTNKNFGIINSAGEILIEPQFLISDFDYNDYRSYQPTFNFGVEKTPGDTAYIINLDGEILFELPEDAVCFGDFDDEIITYYKESYSDSDHTFRAFVVDYDGNIILESENAIRLTEDDSDVFFTRGGIIYPQEFLPRSFEATMYDYEGNIIKDNISFPGDFSSFRYMNFINGLMGYIDDETTLYGFMDEAGNTVIDPAYEIDVDNFLDLWTHMFHTDGYAIVMQNGLYGVIDKQGNVVVDFIYKEITSNMFNSSDYY